MAPWSEFKVGSLPKKGFNNECQRIDTVGHVSHFDSSLFIIENQEIRPSLVFGGSVLNDRRILVSWLSPNHWATGYRYGSVKFEFPFKKLIAGKNYYWIEVIRYEIPAPRILVTNKEYDLEPYDPTIGDGPWWHDHENDEHYYNEKCCLEFMLEGCISLRDLVRVRLVKHHPWWCSVHRRNPKECLTLGFDEESSAAMLITRAISCNQSLETLQSVFVQNSGRPKSNLEFAFDKSSITSIYIQNSNPGA